MDDFTAHQPRRARRHAQGQDGVGLTLPEPLLAAYPPQEPPSRDYGQPPQYPQYSQHPEYAQPPGYSQYPEYAQPPPSQPQQLLTGADSWTNPTGTSAPIDSSIDLRAAEGTPPSRTDPASSWSVRFGVHRATGLLWKVLAALVALDFIGSIGAATGVPYTITRFIDGDDKINIPTGYKTTMLLALTLLLWAQWSLARSRRNLFERGWMLLTFVAAFAFFDETTYLHQSLSDLLHDHLHTHGVLRYAWTIVYMPAALVVAVIVLRYMRYLSSSLRVRLLLGGLAYGFGAVAFEPVKSQTAESLGDGSLLFKVVAAMSDSLEMLGLTLLVVALLSELAQATGSFVVDLRDRAPTGGQQPSRRNAGSVDYSSR